MLRVPALGAAAAAGRRAGASASASVSVSASALGVRGLRTSAVASAPNNAGGSGSGGSGRGLPQREEARPVLGFFTRPNRAPSSPMPRATRATDIAMPHTPPDVPEGQAPNYPDTWTEDQAPRDIAMRGPRFEQMTPELQPQPLSAMEMIQREPIRLTEKRVVECDGGEWQSWAEPGRAG